MKRIFIGLALAALPLVAAADDILVIRDAKIYPVSGPAIEQGTVIVKDGRIAEIQKGAAKIPWGAKVVSAQGKVLIPGLVVAHTFAGTDNPNENVPIAPFISTIDSVDPSSLYFETQLRQGVTSLAVFPGDRAPVGGQGIIVKIRARTVHGMLVKDHLRLKLSLASRGSQMQVMAQIRKAFTDAKKAREKYDEAKKKDDEAKKKDPKAKPAKLPPKPDFKIQPLLDAMDGKLGVLISCNGPGDVLRALELIEQFKLKARLALSGTAYKAHAAIKKAKLQVVLDTAVLHRELDPDSGRETLHPIPKLLADAGIEFSLTPSTSWRAGEAGQLWYLSAISIRHGLSREAALKAITLAPARFIGQTRRVGSIEVGKDGDLVLLSAEPFSVRSFVERVWIDGKSVYRRDKDEWLKRLYYHKRQP